MTHGQDRQPRADNVDGDGCLIWAVDDCVVDGRERDGEVVLSCSCDHTRRLVLHQISVLHVHNVQEEGGLRQAVLAWVADADGDVLLTLLTCTPRELLGAGLHHRTTQVRQSWQANRT